MPNGQPNLSPSNSRKALLVIDMQEGFFADASEPVYREKELVDNINQLTESFRSQHLPVIFIRHTEENGEELQEGTKAWKVYHKLRQKRDDYYLNKETPDSFYRTELASILQENKIDTLYITGLQTDYCIDTTCRSAFAKNYHTILVNDAHSTYDNRFMKAEEIIEYHHKIIGRWFASLQSTNEIIAIRKHE